MGKKSRVKKSHDIEKESVQIQKAAKKKATRKTSIIIIAAIVAFFIVLAAVLATVSAVANSGNNLRNKVSLSTEHIKIDNAMLSYYFYNNFYSFLNTSSSYPSQMGLNTSLSLKAQEYASGETWFDYFMNQTITSLKPVLVLAEAAKVNGIELDEDDKAQIEENISNIKSQAKEYNVSEEKYLFASYGQGVKESDVRRALEVYMLASKQSDALSDSISVTDDEISKYFDENKKDYMCVDYKMFSMSKESYFAKDTIDDKSDAAIEAMANKLASVKSEEEFDAAVKEYLEAAYKNQGKEYTEDDISEAIAQTAYQKEYNDSTDLSTWAFDEARKVGDTKIIKDSEEGNYDIYYLTATAYKDEYTTKTAIQILFKPGNYESDEKAKEAADKVMAEWNASDKTKETFEKLAEKYNEDSVSLYENISNNLTTDFEKWCYDENRKPGDVDMVKTYYGYHIVYFVGDGMVAWQAQVKSTLTSKKYNNTIEQYEKDYPITENKKNFDGVSGKNPSI